MKNKFHWGKALGVVIGLYLTGMIIFLIFSINRDVNLVSDDYYPKELNYQKTIEQKQNAQRLQKILPLDLKNDSVLIALPDEFVPDSVKGMVVFYRPSSSKLDIKHKIKLNDRGVFSASTKKMESGKYQIQLSCVHQGTSYYWEQDLYIE
ncbi:hypothetical protein EMN47_15165 [Prolixibacteraceae bacterium JC049]|nr:hypothetical protein [Prolixibacteraceae bacterium JC049]